MIGKLYLVRVQDNKIIRSFEYDILNLDRKEKLRLKKEFLDSEKYYLRCGCNSKIIMKIDVNGAIYPKNKGTNAISHHKRCPKSSEYYNYSKAYSIDEKTGNVTMSIGFSLNPNKQVKRDKKKTSIDPNKPVSLCKHNESANNFTVSALIKKINTYTWYTYSYRYNYFPTNLYDFKNKIIWSSSKYFNLNTSVDINGKKTKKLYDMMFNPLDYKNLSENDVRFVYMYLDNIIEEKYFYRITGLYSDNKNPFKFVADKEMVLEALKDSGIKLENIKKHNFILGGFVSRNKYNQFKFFQLALVMVNDFGLYSESSYEAIMYNRLTSNEIAFYKPMEPVTDYGNYIPDAILISKNKEKDVIVEVFGYTTPEYINNKNKKIEWFNSKMKDKYELIVWNAHKNEAPPEPDIIKNILDNIKSYK